MKKSPLFHCLTRALAISALLAAGGRSFAATHNWQGPAGGLWSNAANWINGVPTTGEAGGTVVAFDTNTTSVCDFSLTVDEVHFTGSGNTISGSNGAVLTVSGAVQTNNILSDTGTNALASSLPIALSGTLAVFFKTISGTLTIAGNISGGAQPNLTFFGPGTTVLTSASNTYGGTTRVNSGVLQLNSGGVNTAIPGPVIVGSGGGTSSVLRLMQSAEIKDSSTVTVNSDGLFDLNGSSDTIGSLIVLDGTVTQGSAGVLAVATTLQMTGGSISGTGTAALSLGGDVTATSSNATAAQISTQLRLNATRTFTVNAGGLHPELILSGVIANGAAPSGLTKAGTGALLMSQSAPNTYTGTTTVNEGLVTLNGGSSSVIPGLLVVGDGTGGAGTAVVQLGQNSEISNTASVQVNADGAFDLNNFFEQFTGLTVAEGGVVTLGTGTLNIVGSLALSGGTITATSGTLGLSADVTATSGAAASSNISASVSLNATTRIFQVNSGAVQPELVVNGVVSDGSVTPSGLKKTGTGTMKLTGSQSNTFTGVTTVDKGVLQLYQTSGRTIAGSSLVIGNGVDPAGSAILRDLTFSDILSSVAVTLNSSGELDLNGYVETVANLTGTGRVALPTVNNSVSDLAVGSTNGTFSFGGSFSGPGGLRKLGTGVMTLTTAFGGDSLQVFDGTLQLNAPAGSIAPATLQVGDGVGAAGSAVLKLLQSSEIASGTGIKIYSDGNFDFNTLNQAVGNVAIFGGQMSVGTGVMTLNGTLSMTGGSVSGSSGTLVMNGNITATSSASSAIITVPVLLVSSPVITVNPGPVQPELAINSAIAESIGSFGVTKEGAGTLRFNPTANAFTGPLIIDKGIAQFNASSSVVVAGALVIGNDLDPPGTAKVQDLTLLNISGNSTVTVRASGILDLNGFSDRAPVLQGTGWVTSGAGTLTVGTNNASSEFDGNIVNVKITKSGTGTFTLGGTPTIGGSGTITVTAGTLNVAGNRPDANVTVTGTGKLAGNGTAGAITASGATAPVDPGFPDIGTLSAAGNVVFNNPSLLAIRLDDSAGQRVDRLAGQANLNIANATLAISVTGTPTRNAYVLASYGTLTGTFASISGVPAGYTLNYAFNDGTGPHTIAVALPGVAVTGAASNPGKGTATLNGTINPQGRTTSYYFDYGLTAQYGLKTASKGGLTGTSALPVAVPVTGLNGGSTYHFRLVAVNSSGVYYGDDATFVTGGPIVTTMAASSVSALTATLNGTAGPNGGGTTTGYYEYGLTTAYGAKTPVLNFGSGGVAAVPFPLSGLTPGKTYHFRLVAANSAGTSAGADVAFSTKLVLAPIFLPGGQPLSLMKQTGQAATFAVGVAEGSPSPTDAPLSYQWNKNGAPIAGAKSASYTIGTVALAHAGTYTCLIKNAAGSLMSGPAELGVVDAAPKPVSVAQGATATVTVASAGNGLSFAWYKDGAAKGVTSKVYTIPLAQPLDSGSYTCLVSGPGGSVFSGAVALSVFDGKPNIFTPVTMPDGITGGLYSFQVPADPAPERAPTSYVVTGLPAGLTVNATTGLISGRITAVAPPGNKSFPITMKVSNAQGASPVVNTTLLVHPFPAAGIGTYNGLVDRDPLPLGAHTIDDGLGGSVSVTITGIGSYTGKLVLAGTSYPLTGNFNATVGSADLSTTATFARVGQSNLTVTFATDSANGVLAGAVSDPLNGIVVAHSSLRNPWTAAMPTGKAGTYTAEAQIQNGGLIGNAAYPQGRSFATITITPAGAVTWVGKMADGSSPATSFTTTLSAGEAFPVHLMLNAGLGSAQGSLNVTPDSGMPINGGRPLLDGTLDWAKNAQPPGGPDRVYHDGITRFNLTVKGGRYAAPPANTPVLGLTPSGVPGTNNAKITFSQGGLTGPEASLTNRALRITPTNTADLSNPAANPAMLKLTLNAATGAMNGSFVLTDGGATRTVAYAGVIIPRTDVLAGAGYFLLPGLTPTATLSPILSGEVLLTPP